MKNRFLLLLIILMNIIDSAYAISIPQEFKTVSIMFVKMIIGVLISIIVIWFGLNIYKKFINGELFMSKTKDQKPKNNSNNKINKCRIDNAKNIDEAIKTFLTIDNQH